MCGQSGWLSQTSIIIDLVPNGALLESVAEHVHPEPSQEVMALWKDGLRSTLYLISNPHVIQLYASTHHPVITACSIGVVMQ